MFILAPELLNIPIHSISTCIDSSIVILEFFNIQVPLVSISFNHLNIHIHASEIVMNFWKSASELMHITSEFFNFSMVSFLDFSENFPEGSEIILGSSNAS